mgnify:CR=1 FL=1
MAIDLARLERKLGYTFQKTSYLKRALTHCSMGVENYERFEFVGDSILGFVIASELFVKFPLLSEGELSRLRSVLVRGDTLAEIATEMDLGNYLILGQGELRSGGFRRASILADALEAIFAAVYFDGGIQSAREVVLKLYQSRIESADLEACLKDAKTQLQEYLQARKKPLPVYDVVDIQGDAPNQHFKVECKVDGLSIVNGEGTSRRFAEQAAAADILKLLEQ